MPRWVGRCPECGAWGSVTERPTQPTVAGPHAGPVTAPARPVPDVDVHAARHRPTGVSELDRVLGGGLVAGAVVLLAGEPGVGKSTLLLEVAHRVADTGGRALLVTGEESVAQVRLRAERIGAVHERLYLAAETRVEAVMGHVEQVAPDLLVVDSVQTLTSSIVDGSAGGVGQVRTVAAALTTVAKQRGLPVILIGHVTKDGSVAGPRVLEHLVDVVLAFDGDRQSNLRFVRATKNRFGPADEVGCFEMHDRGVRGLADPSELFRSQQRDDVPGTCLTVAIEGRRPLLTEVQALVAATVPGTPRRAVSGLDPARVAMILAVVERRADVRLADRDVFAATVGGLRLLEPAADLAVALAVASAGADRCLPPGLVAVGELGLAGDVRPVVGLDRRLAEAARLGMRTALVPAGHRSVGPPGLRLVEVADLKGLLDRLGGWLAAPERGGSEGRRERDARH